MAGTISAFVESPAEHARRRAGRRGAILLFCWTLLVGSALAWLVRDASSEARSVDRVVVLDDASRETALGEKIRHGLLLAHLGLQPLYPWIFVAPYLFWLTARFPLERGRLRVSLPIQCGAAVLAIAGAHAFRQARVPRKPVMLVWSVMETRSNVGPAVSSNGAPFRGAAGDAGGVLRGRRIVRAGDGDPKVSAGTIPSEDSDLPEPVSRLLAEMRRSPGTSGPVSFPGKSAAAQHVVTEDVFLLGTGSGSSPGHRTNAATNFASRVEVRVNANASEAPWRGVPDILGTAPGPTWLLDLLACGALVGAAHAGFFHRRFRERERRAMSLESHLVRTRLHALQAQLQPHFLFNSLNSVTALLRQDPRAAEEMLVSLSDLLRLALGQSAQPENPLREEMRFLELYLEIQQYRFGDRLRFVAEVEPETRDFALPTLLLQPLVENAVRHGLEPAAHPVSIRMQARRVGEGLELRVEDDGVGCPVAPDRRPKEGIGLSNVRARLDAHYGSEARLDYPEPTGERGFVVRIVLPARESRA